VGADFGIAQEKPAIHQRPSAVLEAKVSQNQAARLEAFGRCQGLPHGSGSRRLTTGLL
jgi:hypothetical protein